MPKLVDDMYLGDGIYASYDGYHIWLDLRGQDDTTRIALEPPALVMLDHYRKSIQAAIEKAQAGD